MALTEGLLEGDVFLFHLKDNEDVSIHWDGKQIQARNTNGYMTFKDKFYRDIYKDKRFIELFETYPEIEVYGIWDEEKFIVTDMMHTDPATGVKTLQHFEYYHHFLAHFDINYRMPRAKLINPTQEYLDFVLSWESGLWNVKNYGKQLFQLVQVKDK